MTTMKKPAPEANREAGYDTAFDSRNHSPMRPHIKAAIFRLAICGLIPPGLATWLLRRLHLGAK